LNWQQEKKTQKKTEYENQNLPSAGMGPHHVSHWQLGLIRRCLAGRCAREMQRQALPIEAFMQASSIKSRGWLVELEPLVHYRRGFLFIYLFIFLSSSITFSLFRCIVHDPAAPAWFLDDELALQHGSIG